MKTLGAALLGLALAAGTVPATAAERTTVTKTTVTKVHGPLKLLPDHKRKYCRMKWVNHHRVKKCWYH